MPVARECLAGRVGFLCAMNSLHLQNSKPMCQQPLFTLYLTSLACRDHPHSSLSTALEFQFRMLAVRAPVSAEQVLSCTIPYYSNPVMLGINYDMSFQKPATPLQTRTLKFLSMIFYLKSGSHQVLNSCLLSCTKVRQFFPITRPLAFRNPYGF